MCIPGISFWQSRQAAKFVKRVPRVLCVLRLWEEFLFGLFFDCGNNQYIALRFVENRFGDAAKQGFM